MSRVRMVADLRHWDAFRPPVEAGQPLRWAQRPVLHALIVNLWRNRTSESDGEHVSLTNATVSEAYGWSRGLTHGTLQLLDELKLLAQGQTLCF